MERGPAGPKGATGAQGPQGPAGPGLASFDSLAGLGCSIDEQAGAISIAYDGSGLAQIRCVAAVGGDAVIRINEFSVGIEGTLGDEFVEIANTGTAAADLSGWKLVYRSGAGTERTFRSARLRTARCWLREHSSSSEARATPARIRPTSRSRPGLASAAGGVAIKDADGNIVDSVGWGDATNAFVEGTTAAAPPIAPAPGKSDARHPNGHDTNVNSADFTIGDPTPGVTN